MKRWLKKAEEGGVVLRSAPIHADANTSESSQSKEDFMLNDDDYDDVPAELMKLSNRPARRFILHLQYGNVEFDGNVEKPEFWCGYRDLLREDAVVIVVAPYFQAEILMERRVSVGFETRLLGGRFWLNPKQ